MNAMTKPGGKKYFCGTASDLLFFLCSFQLVTRPGAVNKSRLLAKNITCHPDLNNAQVNSLLLCETDEKEAAISQEAIKIIQERLYETLFGFHLTKI